MAAIRSVRLQGYQHQDAQPAPPARVPWASNGTPHPCAIAALLQQANGALFPSLAEGFGLPPAAAVAMGTPVICCDLPVYRDILGDIPIYLKASDPYSWANKIKEMAEQRPPHTDYQPPDWDRHFNLVLNRV